MDELAQLRSGRKGKSQESSAETPFGNLLGALLGGGQSTGGDPLGGLLSGLLGGGAQQPGAGADEMAGFAAQASVTPAVLQAVVALLAGRLTGQGATQADSAGLSALLTQAQSGEEVDEAALRSSGLPQELTKTTGLDLVSAIRVLQKLLPSLAGLLNLPGLRPAAKPKPKPEPAAKPSVRPKPKPAAAAKPKPKPASTASAKPKPKPAASTTAKPKPATSTASKPKTAGSAKPRPRKSDGVVEINLDEPTTEN